MSKVIKVIGCILAAVGLGCIVKHVVMMRNGTLDECCCLQHLKNKDWGSIHKWKTGSCCGGDHEGFTGEEEDVEPISKKSALDAAVDQFANGEITREQFDEIKRNLI